MAVGINDGPYRLRGAADVALHSHGYGHQTTFGQKLAGGFRAILRMVMPVLSLSVALAAMYLYMDTTLPYLADSAGKWLTVSHLLIPVAFLAIHLTNRRYGPSYAFAQVVITLALLTAGVMFGRNIILKFLPDAAAPSVRDVIAFGSAFFVAGFASIVVFDGSRGPRWWTAPLIGSLAAALLFTLVFYPAAYLGTATAWVDHMWMHGALLFAGAVLSLVPFWMLRRLVQPLPGYGGY